MMPEITVEDINIKGDREEGVSIIESTNAINKQVYQKIPRPKWFRDFLSAYKVYFEGA